MHEPIIMRVRPFFYTIIQTEIEFKHDELITYYIVIVFRHNQLNKMLYNTHLLGTTVLAISYCSQFIDNAFQRYLPPFDH